MAWEDGRPELSSVSEGRDGTVSSSSSQLASGVGSSLYDDMLRTSSAGGVSLCAIACRGLDVIDGSAVHGKPTRYAVSGRPMAHRSIVGYIAGLERSEAKKRTCSKTGQHALD
jgi:hypothetical protein